MPVTIKINIDVEGQANSNGVVGFKNNIAPWRLTGGANLKKAGAIIIGMTNTPEFSMRGFTEQSAARADEEPMGPRDYLWRLIRRSGRIDRCGHRRHCARQ